MWLHFDMVRVGGVKLARCKDLKCEANKKPSKFCELAGNSTINLWRHLRSHHHELSAVEEDIQLKKTKLREHEKKSAAESLSKFVFKPDPQLQLTELVPCKLPSYQNSHPKQKRFHRNLKNLIVNDALPFKLANSPWLIKLVKDLDGQVNVKSRVSYSREVKKEGRIMKRRSRAHVRNNITGAYAAAADIWTSKGQTDYLGINAMFIDASWRWQKIVVACRPFEEQHTGINLRNTLKKESDALDIPEDVVKVFVTDTAPDIMAGRRVAGFSSISCCIHKLQLVGSDAENAIGTEGVKEALKAARNLVTHSHHCGPFHRTMKKYCRRNNHNFTKLAGHVKTRWNSNKMMVNKLLDHRACIQGMETDEAVPNMPIIEMAQWRILKQLKNILAPMERVTKVWESETEPTMTMVGVEVYNLKTEWEEMIKEEEDAMIGSFNIDDPAILKFLKSLHFNLLRRFPQLGMDTDLAAWGNIFHPRYKV